GKELLRERFAEDYGSFRRRTVFFAKTAAAQNGDTQSGKIAGSDETIADHSTRAGAELRVAGNFEGGEKSSLHAAGGRQGVAQGQRSDARHLLQLSFELIEKRELLVRV